MKISVICPTFNEVENIPFLVRALENALTGFDYEIIISDDDSPDRTWACAEAIARHDSRVRVLRRKVNRGLGWSVIDGFNAASGEVVACMDADLQHDPGILPLMLKEMERGSDVVLASRYTHGGSAGEWRMHRRAQSWMATKAAQAVLRIRVSDPMSGYFLMRRSDFLRVRDRLDGSGYKILLELLVHANPARISEVPFTFRPRRAGDSKLSSRVVWCYVAQLWRLKRFGRTRHIAPPRSIS